MESLGLVVVSGIPEDDSAPVLVQTGIQDEGPDMASDFQRAAAAAAAAA